MFGIFHFFFVLRRQSVQFFAHTHTHTDCFRHVASNGCTTHRSLPIWTFRTETPDLFDELFDLFFDVERHLCVRVAPAREGTFFRDSTETFGVLGGTADEWLALPFLDLDPLP